MLAVANGHTSDQASDRGPGTMITRSYRMLVVAWHQASPWRYRSGCCHHYRNCHCYCYCYCCYRS